MSTKPSGYGTMQIGGQERPYQVGTNQGDVFCRLHHRKDDTGAPLSLKAYSELFSPARLGKQQLTGGDLRDFIYSALAAGYDNDGLRVDFSAFDVGNWLDDADDDKELVKPLQTMLAQLVRRAELAAERAHGTAGKKPKAPAKTPPPEPMESPN